ncbi:MAG: alpha-amylase [Bacteroidetes bacterium]|nr:alpha-amylase [Bacteroidota bacterium]
MINIYQLFPRVFGNKVSQEVHFGSIESNGCGKFSSVDHKALEAIRELGITHVWLTGVLRHASMTDYSAFGIPRNHPQVVKGRAGSPYAITDYYDVDPDLADDVPSRLKEFKSLIDRMHENKLYVMIDFVANHVSRQYHSVAKPKGVAEFGEHDDPAVVFSPSNNFYYLPGQALVTPVSKSAELASYDEPYTEFPAKVTGNDCFRPNPSVNDWFETVKLNYGIDFTGEKQTYFEPIPPTWHAMAEILHYWASMGVDGFRADMAEMVPAAFWKWAIGKLKADFPDIVMIAEIYRPDLYKPFIEAGFDFLYDKVGLYNRLHDILRYGHAAESLSICWKMLEVRDHRMLRFMENHDEMRLASSKFLGNARKALPAVAVSALMHRGPFMIYNGQETGEKGTACPGHSCDDGKTSIFDYTHMPAHQAWMNEGAFDGGKLNPEQQYLFNYYKQLLRFRLDLPALHSGSFYDLMWANPWYTDFDPRFVYAFMRFTLKQRLIILSNFNDSDSRNMRLNVPIDALLKADIPIEQGEQWLATNLMNPADKIVFKPADLPEEGLHISIGPLETAIYELQPIY